MLNNEDINASGSGNNSNSKLGSHIKNEEQATDPLASAENNNFGSSNLATQNRSMIPQNSPDRIQPLPSNVVNKQSNSMDVRISLISILNLIFQYFILYFSTCSNKVKFLYFQRLWRIKELMQFEVVSFPL